MQVDRRILDEQRKAFQELRRKNCKRKIVVED